MKTVAELLQGLAAVAWPLITLLLLLLFRTSIDAVVQSAKNRKFTIKIGGNELTMDEAAEQQSKILADLQNDVVELRKRLDSAAPASRSIPPAVGGAKAAPVRSVLWVDDNPRNNSYEIDILQKQGVAVVTATSTADAMALFSHQKFDRVISDMGRTENGLYKKEAGKELAAAIHQMDSAVPIIIYTSARGVAEHRTAARAAGVTATVSSGTSLLEALNLGDARANA